MARISLSEILQNIAGSVGEHTYGCWKGVNYVRQKSVTLSNPCSVIQSTVRAALSAVSRAWYTTLTAAQRVLWNEYAQSLKSAGEQVGPNGNGGASLLQVIPDSGGVLSGFNAFVQLNVTALRAGFVVPTLPVPDAPVGITGPNAPTDLSGSYCWDGYNRVINLSWVDPVDPVGNENIRVWLLSTDAGVHRQINTVLGLTVETFNIFAVQVALGHGTLIQNVPGHYLVQIDCVNSYGQKSPPSNTLSVEVIPGVPPGC